MTASALNRRKVWTMSCEALFQNFAASLTPEFIVKLFRRHRYPVPDATFNDVALFHLAHEYCHRDSPLSRQVQRYLNRKYEGLISRIAQLPPLSVRAETAKVLTQEAFSVANPLPGMLWALCSDPREEIRSIEKVFIEELHLRSHSMLLAQFRGEIRVGGDNGPDADAEHEALQETVKLLETDRHELQRGVQNLERDNSRIRDENTGLRNDLGTLRRRFAELEKQSMSQAMQGVKAREVRKLQYEVARLNDALRDRETEVARLASMVASREPAPQLHEDPTPESMHYESPLHEWPDFDLRGKRVALIGGLNKASGHYEQTIRELGGRCMRYEDRASQGQRKLASIIRQADVVFCPVDCVSHGTANAAKKLCRSLDKPCHFLRSSGISHVREKLREVVAG